MTARPVVSVDTRLAEIEQREQAATPGPWSIDGPPDDYKSVLLLNQRGGAVIGQQIATEIDADEDAEFIAHARTDVPWLLSQLRDARAENERLRAAYQTVCGYAETVDKVTAERDDLRTRLAAAERGLEMTDAELDGTRKRADRAEAALAAVREWATGNYGGTKRPIDVWPGLAAALAAAEQDEPALPESMLTGPATFEFDEQEEEEPKRGNICQGCGRQMIGRPPACDPVACPGPVSQPTEGATE